MPRHHLDPLLDERAEDLYENAPCGYLSTLPGGEIVKVNGTLLAWTGFERGDVLGRRFQDLLTAGGRIYHETHYAPLLRMQGEVREIALEIICAGGRRMSVLVNSVLRTDDAGEPRFVRTTVFDATHRRRYERELVRAREGERAARMRTERLQRLSAALAAAVDAPGMAEAAVAQIVESLDPAEVSIALTDADTGRSYVLARRGDGTAADPATGGVLMLAIQGKQIGILRVVPRPSHALEAEDRAFLDACAAQCSQALERARLYEHERRVALALQESLLAGDVPRDPRFEVASCYLPAVASLQVCGDWHDTFAVGEGSIGLVVGDVVGRGIEAASAMGQLRSATRALAGADLGPAGLLEHLDAFVKHLPGAYMATLAYAELDLRSGRLCYVCAGHPPPVAIQPGEDAAVLWDGRSAPLGAALDARSKPAGRIDLRAEARLVLYTDGLVERRGTSIDTRLQTLAEDVAARRAEPLSQLARGLVDTLVSEDDPVDDVCLLCLEYRPRAEV